MMTIDFDNSIILSKASRFCAEVLKLKKPQFAITLGFLIWTINNVTESKVTRY